MMMMASTKKSRKKKTIKVQMLRRPNQCRLPETSSVVVETGSEIQQRPRQELQEQKDPVDEKIQGRLLPRSVILFSFVRVAEVGIGGQIQIVFVF